jgi:hypothetical protein
MLASALGCADLPVIASGACGNGVVEPPEDCDTFAPTTTSTCLPPGSTGECHLDCRRGSDGDRRSCPTGWGCDLQNICRKPTGDFVAGSPPTPVGGAWSLMAGDFDGDGRGDVVSLELPDIRGATGLRFHYFDAAGALAETRTFPKLLASPAIAALSADARSDLVFSSELYAVGVLLGQRDRSWVPETAGSYRFPGAAVRILSASDVDIESSTPILGLTTIDGTSGLYGPDENGSLRLRGNIPGTVETLVGDPVSGDVIEDAQVSPCRELVFAVGGATSFPLVDVCTRDPATTEIVWRDQVTEWSVALEPPAPIDAPAQLTDMNGDGHLDVLIGAGGKAYVAYGDGQGLRTAVPYRVPTGDSAAGSAEIAMPLAAGDFSGDGVVDFVFGDHLLVSTRASAGSGVSYIATYPNSAAEWTVARIVDLNHNGKPDVVAASSGRLGIDFFNGTGTEHLLAFRIPTDGPVSQLAVADLDGDLINDLVFVEKAPSETERDSLMIAFGGLSGPPAEPTLVARIRHIDQLNASYRSGVALLIVAYTETGDGAPSDGSVGGTDSGVLAFLTGTGDRLPFAPYSLVNVSEGGSVFDEAAVAVAVGKFLPGSHGDVLALGASGETGHLIYAFWLLPGIATPPSKAVRLGGPIDPRLRPVEAHALLTDVNVTAAAADLDRDGSDEAVWAIPADAGAACGLSIVGTRSEGAAELVVRGTIVVDAPCLRPQLVPVDADGDGAVDLALLTGGPGSPGRRLLVLWNDGAGGFSSADVATVSVAGDSPEQFAVLPATPDRPVSLAYVTRGAAKLVSAATASGARLFGPPRALADLQDGSGIVAVDVNGDGVLDLALAAAGNLSILQGGLATP